MGEVYVAHDDTLGRDVALKLLPEDVASNPHRLARLEREARLLASLSHPNIGAIYSVIHEGPVQALVLELVDGLTLDAMLARGPLPLKRALEIARQIAEALDAAHEKSIVHRDLKPANVKVTSTGIVKVLDFGIAKALTSTEALDIDAVETVSMATREGTILGTTRYMSPEQARGFPVDKRTDIWAFACVLFEMLAGHRTFDGPSNQDTVAAILEREPDWRLLPPSTPPAIVRLLRRCLEKDPQRRLRDIADARSDIDDVLGATDSEAATAGTPVRQSASRWMHLVWAAATVAALVFGMVWRNWMPAARPSGAVTRLALPLGGLTLPSEVSPFAISSDGRRIVIATSTSGLYVRDLAEPELHQIGGTVGAIFPFFSPDGDWVGFIADGLLKKVAVSGGSPIVICQLSWGAVRGMSWSPDGTIVVGMTNTMLMRVRADGGQLQPFSKLDAALDETSHRWPHVLPGGHAIVFAAGPSVSATEWNAAQIVAQSVLTGERRVVVPRGSSPAFAAGYLFYMAGHTLFAQAFDVDRLAVQGPVITVATDVNRGGSGAGWFAVSDTALVTARGAEPKPRTLVWLDRTGAVTPLALPAADYFFPRLSPDGTRVAVTVSNPDSDIWVYDVAGGGATRITSDGKSLWPLWSPDGTRVAFSSTRGAPSAIRSRRADGSGQEETLVTNSFINQARCWTRNSGLGYTLVEPSTGADAWILLPSAAATAVSRTRFAEGGTCPSPDGRWIAFQSDQSGTYEVYIQPMTPAEGQPQQVSAGGGFAHSWSHDGREFYFGRGNELWSVRVPNIANSRFEARRVLQAPFDFGSTSSNYDIAADGRLLVVRRETSEPAIKELDLTLNWTLSPTATSVLIK